PACVFVAELLLGSAYVAQRSGCAAYVHFGRASERGMWARHRGDAARLEHEAISVLTDEDRQRPPQALRGLAAEMSRAFDAALVVVPGDCDLRMCQTEAERIAAHGTSVLI